MLDTIQPQQEILSVDGLVNAEAVSTAERIIMGFSNLAWGAPLLVVLIGGGIFFMIYSRLLPLKYFRHAIRILAGKYDNPDEPGQINHYQALSTALAATVGMGNISGVAIAITMGGPGAVFWMWISALVGVTTKFFTCTLSVLYRGRDSNGEIQGGPMYYIVEGLGKKWRPMAVFFSLMGMIGVLPMFQVNQLTQVIRDIVLEPAGVKTGFVTNLASGLVFSSLVALVIFGGIKRIGKVTGRLVPFMVVIYFLSVMYIVLTNIDMVLPSFALIFRDAFTANSVLGGSVGALIIVGVRRAAFSNEAGIGTAPMAHGAAKTSEPVREGLVAMMEPVIDTIIVCTLTALALIITGVWDSGEANGITLTANAFRTGIPRIGVLLLTISVTVFALSTMLAFPYYGSKCFSFIFGARRRNIYNWFYVLTIPLGATATLGMVIGLIDGAYAMMAFPNMIAALLLSPAVLRAAKDYFRRLRNNPDG